MVVSDFEDTARPQLTDRFDVLVFPVGVNLVSESTGFSERHAWPRIASPYVLHQVRFVGELVVDVSTFDKETDAIY